MILARIRVRDSMLNSIERAGLRAGYFLQGKTLRELSASARILRRSLEDLALRAGCSKAKIRLAYYRGLRRGRRRKPIPTGGC
jgi:hypothetical protein